MFDPQRLQRSDRRMQRKSQIIRSKGIVSLPQGVITQKDMKSWASILKVNKIPAYVPPTPEPTPGNQFPLIIQNISYNFQTYELSPFLTGFTHATESKTIEVTPLQDIMIISMVQGELCIYLFTNGTVSVDQDSWYFLFDHKTTPYVFNVSTSDDPDKLTPLFKISATDQNLWVLFNPDVVTCPLFIPEN